MIILLSLRHWCIDYEEKLSEIIANLLISKYPQNSPTKRKRPLKNSQSNNSPTSEQVSSFLKASNKISKYFYVNFQLLNHLEHLRRACRHGSGIGTGLYVQDSMQRALQQAFSHSTDSQKVRTFLGCWESYNNFLP